MAVSAIARPSSLRRRVTSGLLALLALTAVAGECFFVATPAQAQLLVFPPRPPRPKVAGSLHDFLDPKILPATFRGQHLMGARNR